MILAVCDSDHEMACVCVCLGYEKYNQIRQDPGLCFLARCGPPDGSALLAEQDDNDDDIK